LSEVDLMVCGGKTKNWQLPVFCFVDCVGGYSVVYAITISSAISAVIRPAT
jgi:hypothetical protein